MQVHRRWLKLALVAVALMHAVADAQVYTMESNLDGSDSDSGSDPTVIRTPTPTAKRPTRTWIPITDAPSDSSETTDTPATTKKPRATTKTPRTTPPVTSDDSETGLSDSSGTTQKKSSDSESTTESALESTDESGSDEAAESTDASGASTTTKKKKKKIFTRSPYLQQTTPVPDGIPTADDSNSGESASTTESNSEDSSASSKTSKSKTSKSTKTKKNSSDSTSGSDSSAASSKKTSKSKSSNSTKQSSDAGTSGTDQANQTDQTDGATTTPSSGSSTNSSSASGSSSAASVMADSANSSKPRTNTLMLGLMMGGAVALVMLVAVFVYIKTSNKDEEDDDMDPGFRTARHDMSKGTAQTSTLNANYHENDNMSPMQQYSDDDYYPNNQQQHSGQYDQDPYGHPGQGHSGQYNDDYLTPQSQIELAHSGASLPPMAQTNYSHGDSQYSQYSAGESSFYSQSAYSADPSSVSQVVSKYPGMRHGGENDVAGSEEEESDFEGDSIQDMSRTQNDWNSAGRNRSSTDGSAMDQSMVESGFHPSDTRSTAAASGYRGNNQFAESEYTEYRVSTDYDSSYVNGKGGYDQSFAASQSGYDQSGYNQSGYDQSFAASQSGYDQSYAGHKSFESSGFSEYESGAPPRGRGDSTNSDASSFYRTKDSSYY